MASVLGPPEESFDELKVKLSRLALRLNDMNEDVDWEEVGMIANGFIVKGDQLRRIAGTEKLAKK